MLNEKMKQNVKFKNSTLKFDKKNYKATTFSVSRAVSELKAQELRKKGWLARLSEGIVYVPYTHVGRDNKKSTGIETLMAWIVYTRRPE
jgi:predicted transcriptional regulator of viral defense system